MLIYTLFRMLTLKRSIAVLTEACIQPSSVCFYYTQKSVTLKHETTKIVGNILTQAIPKVEMTAWTKRVELPTSCKFKEPLLID